MVKKTDILSTKRILLGKFTSQMENINFTTKYMYCKMLDMRSRKSVLMANLQHQLAAASL
jgi:hypothetical protein